MKSMTGYGEASVETRGTRITVQLRSLNHRHLDLQIRSPREYLSFEEEIRKAIREKISRGRVEAFITRTAANENHRKVELNEDLFGQYLRAMHYAKKKFGLAGELDLALFSNFSELFQFRQVEADPAREKTALFKALRVAVQKLALSRTREGRHLKVDLQSQLRSLIKISVALEQGTLRNVVRVQKPLTTVRAGSLPTVIEKDGTEGNNSILKGDVNEEIVRLKSHITALNSMVQEKEPVGKKIDFILQEAQRELNTISAKQPQLSIVRLVLEGKERVEKIREQAQNIE